MTASTSNSRRPVHGILLLDKPGELTSNRALQRVKRLYMAEKAGHTGTLDPMATGLLPICFGAATRVSGLMLGASKTYAVTAHFGVATDTGDATGRETDRCDRAGVSREAVALACRELTGKISQIPPMYSALKFEGRRLYKLARAGREVPRPPRSVEIFSLQIEAFDWPSVRLTVHCSKGTYVRTLVEDIAGRLGTLAHVAELRRLSVGPYAADQMVSVEQVEQAAERGEEAMDSLLLGIDTALMDRPSVAVSAQAAIRLRQGQRIQLETDRPEDSVRIYEMGGAFVGLGEVAESGELKPARIFPL